MRAIGRPVRPVVPITTTWWGSAPVGRPVQSLPVAPNPPPPAFVQHPRKRGQWMTMVRKAEKAPPAGSTVTLYRKGA